MRKLNKWRVIEAATKARRFALAPYSRFQVGAALLSETGRIFTGANVESASYGLTCCAERVALFKALTEGAKKFMALAVVADVPKGPMPCGACRQLLAEYAPDAVIWTVDTRNPGEAREWRLAELLPLPFIRTRRKAGRLRSTS